MSYYNKKESCPWLYEFDGPPTTPFEKSLFKWEYALEQDTEGNTRFKEIYAEDSIIPAKIIQNT